LKVLKRAFITVGILFLIFSFIVVIAITNQGFRIVLEEGFYIASDSSYNLAHLSSDLIYTNHYNLKIKYLKIAVEDDRTLDIIKDDIGLSDFSLSYIQVTNKDSLIDLFQCEYLEAYIMTSNYDTFKSELFNLENSFQTKEVFLNYFLAKILQNDFTNDQLIELSKIYYEKLDIDINSNDYSKVFIDYKILASIALHNKDIDTFNLFEANALDVLTRID